jgi:hypothetical protein
VIDCLQMSAATFGAELRRHGFRISGTQVVDISGTRPGFAITAVVRRGQIDRAASIAHALTTRDAEIAERKLRAWEDGKVSAEVRRNARDRTGARRGGHGAGARVHGTDHIRGGVGRIHQGRAIASRTEGARFGRPRAAATLGRACPMTREHLRPRSVRVVSNSREIASSRCPAKPAVGGRSSPDANGQIDRARSLRKAVQGRRTPSATRLRLPSRHCAGGEGAEGSAQADPSCVWGRESPRVRGEPGRSLRRRCAGGCDAAGALVAKKSGFMSSLPFTSRRDDVGVGRAAADIAAHPLGDLGIGQDRRGGKVFHGVARPAEVSLNSSLRDRPLRLSRMAWRFDS